MTTESAKNGALGSAALKSDESGDRGESRESLRRRLVMAALEHVPFDGWSDKALLRACAHLGVDTSMASVLFPQGARTAVECFTALADAMMAEDIAAAEVESMAVRDRIIAAVRLRLERWEPHREAVRRALSVYALPGTMTVGVRDTWRTVDTMWKAIGDHASGFSWYTKRASLGAVYSATLLYWLDDQSEGHEETWSFLARRVDNVVKAIQTRRRMTSSLGKTLCHLPNPLCSLSRQTSSRSGEQMNL